MTSNTSHNNIASSPRWAEVELELVVFQPDKATNICLYNNYYIVRTMQFTTVAVLTAGTFPPKCWATAFAIEGFSATHRILVTIARHKMMHIAILGEPFVAMGWWIIIGVSQTRRFNANTVSELRGGTNELPSWSRLSSYDSAVSVHRSYQHQKWYNSHKRRSMNWGWNRLWLLIRLCEPLKKYMHSSEGCEHYFHAN